MRIGIFAHILSCYRGDFFHNWPDDFEIYSCRCYRWKPYEDNWNMNTLLFIFVVIANNISSAGWVWKEYAKPWGATEPLANLLCTFKGSSCLPYLFVFNEGKFWKHLYFFNNAIVGHQLSHIAFVIVLRDTTKPKFTHKNVAGFISYYLLGIWYLIHGWILGEIIGVGSWIVWIVLIVLIAWRRERLGGKPFSIEIIFDVHFPGGVSLMESVDDISGEGLVASHGDKGVAEEVVFAASIIALYDPECMSCYLTSFSWAIGYRICLSCYSSKSSGSCPI